MNPSELVSNLQYPMESLDTSKYSYKSVIIAALTWDNDSWVPEALDWIDSGVELDNEIVKALEEISSNKENTQKNRHRAFAIAKRWLRNNANT